MYKKVTAQKRSLVEVIADEIQAAAMDEIDDSRAACLSMARRVLAVTGISELRIENDRVLKDYIRMRSERDALRMALKGLLDLDEMDPGECSDYDIDNAFAVARLTITSTPTGDDSCTKK